MGAAEIVVVGEMAEEYRDWARLCAQRQTRFLHGMRVARQVFGVYD